jgi:hypothetical protein
MLSQKKEGDWIIRSTRLVHKPCRHLHRVGGHCFPTAHAKLPGSRRVHYCDSRPRSELLLRSLCGSGLRSDVPQSAWVSSFTQRCGSPDFRLIWSLLFHKYAWVTWERRRTTPYLAPGSLRHLAPLVCEHTRQGKVDPEAESGDARQRLAVRTVRRRGARPGACHGEAACNCSGSSWTGLGDGSVSQVRLHRLRCRRLRRVSRRWNVASRASCREKPDQIIRRRGPFCGQGLHPLPVRCA